MSTNKATALAVAEKLVDIMHTNMLFKDYGWSKQTVARAFLLVAMSLVDSLPEDERDVNWDDMEAFNFTDVELFLDMYYDERMLCPCCQGTASHVSPDPKMLPLSCACAGGLVKRIETADIQCEHSDEPVYGNRPRDRKIDENGLIIGGVGGNNKNRRMP